jgi:hypothetical protein
MQSQGGREIWPRVELEGQFTDVDGSYHLFRNVLKHAAFKVADGPYRSAWVSPFDYLIPA